jgi:hypothetical protein
MSTPRRRPSIALLLAAALVAAAEDDTAIPPLQPEALTPWWPSIQGRLPQAFASLSGDGVAGDGPATVGGSAWAGVLRHPSPAWTWGAAAGYHQQRADYGEGLPEDWRSARVLVGAWRRFSLDDHLVFGVAPGATWSEASDGVQFSMPLAGLYLHRSSRTTTWAFGAIGLVGPTKPIVVPVIAAFLNRGPWDITLTPIFLAADRLVTKDLTIGAFAGLSGDGVPVDEDDRELEAVYWDVRLGLRAKWKPTERWSLSADAGWAVVRRALLIERDGEPDTLIDRHLEPAPFASLATTWTW